MWSAWMNSTTMVTHLLNLCVTAFIAVSGYGAMLAYAAPAMIPLIPLWQSLAFGSVLYASGHGICFFGRVRDRLLERKERERMALLDAFRR